MHLQSCKLQAKTYGWNDEKLKQNLEKAREVYFETHGMTFKLNKRTRSAISNTRYDHYAVTNEAKKRN